MLLWANYNDKTDLHTNLSQTQKAECKRERKETFLSLRESVLKWCTYTVWLKIRGYNNDEYKFEFMYKYINTKHIICVIRRYIICKKIQVRRCTILCTVFTLIMRMKIFNRVLSRICQKYRCYNYVHNVHIFKKQRSSAILRIKKLFTSYLWEILVFTTLHGRKDLTFHHGGFMEINTSQRSHSYRLQAQAVQAQANTNQK